MSEKRYSKKIGEIENSIGFICVPGKVIENFSLEKPGNDGKYFLLLNERKIEIGRVFKKETQKQKIKILSGYIYIIGESTNQDFKNQENYLVVKKLKITIFEDREKKGLANIVVDV